MVTVSTFAASAGLCVPRRARRTAPATSACARENDGSKILAASTLGALLSATIAMPASAEYLPHGKLINGPDDANSSFATPAPASQPRPVESKPVAAPSVVASTPVAASKASDQPASRVATQVPTANMTAPSSGGLDATFAGVAAASALGVAGLLVATDPQKRREAQMSLTSGDELAAVKSYFETEGFKRWDKIYGETDEVNNVQLDIRIGHAQTVEKVLKWLDEEGGVKGVTVADCGCGTGSLAIPLALRGAAVSASDISSNMAKEAQRRYESAVREGSNPPEVAPVFEAKDLESVDGKYHTVTCLDVMIHYPQDKADAMVQHLASLADKRLILSFAPKTPYYSFLKRVGELFPGPSKATRAYLHAEEDVEESLQKAGFKVVKREMTATKFYFSRLLEAVRT